MNTLFDIAPAFPEGFEYVEDFLSIDEEQALHSIVTNLPLHKFSFQGYTANRNVASFGYDYSFENARLIKGEAIPKGFDFLIQKVSKRLGIVTGEFGELLVTEYPPDSVINWHRDAPPFDIIAGISLMADCTFRLRPHDKARQGRGSVISFPVRRRSLYVIKGASRTDWQHSISPVKQTRYSVTLRTLAQASI